MKEGVSLQLLMCMTGFVVAWLLRKASSSLLEFGGSGVLEIGKCLKGRGGLTWWW